MNWLLKSVNPKHSGWYITGSLDSPSHSVPRYFSNDNNSWWIARDNGGSDSIWPDEDEDHLVPNNSFDMWCEMPTLKGRTR